MPKFSDGSPYGGSDGSPRFDAYCGRSMHCNANRPLLVHSSAIFSTARVLLLSCFHFLSRFLTAFLSLAAVRSFNLQPFSPYFRLSPTTVTPSSPRRRPPLRRPPPHPGSRQPRFENVFPFSLSIYLSISLTLASSFCPFSSTSSSLLLLGEKLAEVSTTSGQVGSLSSPSIYLSIHPSIYQWTARLIGRSDGATGIKTSFRHHS